MQVSKWGNSLAIRLPRKLVDSLGLKEGDEIDVVSAVDHLLAIEKRVDRETALARMATRGWTVPDGYRFNREEANNR